MADTKISALTALTGANIATDDELPIVDTSVTTTKKTTMADLSARTETMTNKTLDKAVLLGVPAAEGAIGRDTTQKSSSAFNNGMFGTDVRVLTAGVGTQTLINSTASDQPFTSIYLLPANVLFTNKILRVSVLFEFITGTSSVTFQPYLALVVGGGGATTKVYTRATAANPADGVTRSLTFVFYIFGRAAAGAAAAISAAAVYPDLGTAAACNIVDQPVNVATNGTLDIVPGITFSGTGSTESLELQAWCVEELN